MAVIYSNLAKRIAGAIALIAGATLLLRIVLKFEETGSVFGAVSYLSQFFTILTNTLVFAMSLVVFFGVQVWPRLTQSLTIAIVGVGLVYHTALAHLLDLSGLALLADHGVHTIVPGITLVWWLFVAPKRQFRPSDPIVWVIWPVAYCAYILLRASSSGFYPYPFLNLPELGVGGLVQSIVLLCVAFVVVGLVLSGLSRVIGKAVSVA